MIEDFRGRDDGVVIESDLCVIGAGAAGIALAREFSGTRRTLCLIESGGLEPEAATQALYEGRNVGAPYPPLEATRLRYFGGTTNHWDGHCRPLDAIDFETRPWVPYSGWPITRQDLDPFYARAHAVLELGPYQYAPEAWRTTLPGLIAFQPERLVNRLWQYSPPTRLGIRYRDALARAANVRVLLNTNAVEIVVNAAATTVEAVRLKTLDGKAGTVRPKAVVLACGGIENARLLLASNRVMRTGLGNGHDRVGRFFLEHPHAQIAFAVPTAPLDRFRVYFGGIEATAPAGTAVIQAKPGLSESLQRRERLLNGCIDVGYGYDRSPGYLSLRHVAKAFGRGAVPDDLGGAVLRMVGDLDGLAVGLYRRFTDENVFWFGANAEQAPNPESRVTLDDTVDTLGLPRARLDWRLSAIDKRTTRVACRVVGEELARLGIARMRIDDWLLVEDARWTELGIRYHHMGTTRMSDDPTQGVVDRHGRVHGLANLYVAGSSVFPTAGYANPTLTIVALALRLADYLKERGGA
jgi:choline dehydrogenase-like flavoprotein